MKYYIWTIIVVLVIDIFGKALLLRDREFTRNPTGMAWDILINTILIVWGMYALGFGK